MNNIGIIGAMSEELSLIKSVMSIEKTFEKAGYTFFSGKLGNKDIVLVLCGIGKVNAAVCTQLLIDTFSVEAVINTGVAGAVANGVTKVMLSYPLMPSSTIWTVHPLATLWE